MNNSANLKDDNGKYSKLPICPVCTKKVHIDEDDVNVQAWSFSGHKDFGGDFMHDDCASPEHPTEGGYTGE